MRFYCRMHDLCYSVGLIHRLVGRPGSYLYVVGSYRMEEVRERNGAISRLDNTSTAIRGELTL